MKNLILIFILLGLFQGKAQEEDASEDNLHLSVYVPEVMEGLHSGHLSKMATKMQKMVTNYGISGEGYIDKFVMYPKYEIYDQEILEGMQNLHILKVEFNLLIKELKTGKIYSTYTQSITGEGTTQSKAITQSISQIKTRGDKIASFLSKAKQKILNYYRTHCDQIYEEADNLIRRKNFKDAIALLYPVPREAGADCYAKIQRKLDEAYLGYENKTCEKNIADAKNAMRENNDKTALEILAEIDPASNCNKTAISLRLKIEAKTTKTTVKTSTSDKPITEGATQTEVKTRTIRKETSISVKKRRSKKIKTIAARQYRSRHQSVIDKI
ncbi:hypothetical protein [Spongiimicrobium salis]|uniref:hypothetical protein n=1 Tax=Spongiimicrobium salis TaxID=1667022 RepID=UPI00374DB65F